MTSYMTSRPALIPALVPLHCLDALDREQSRAGNLARRQQTCKMTCRHACSGQGHVSGCIHGSWDSGVDTYAWSQDAGAITMIAEWGE